jgi:peptide/nickel transport system ATP-binding protein
MLKIDTLSVRFRRHDGPPVPVLTGLDLCARRGAVTGIVGASGAGKSLVAAAIAGTLPRNAEMTGRITLDGAPLAPGRIAYAPQGIDALDPLAPIGRQIERFARLAGRRQVPADLLGTLGLAPDIARAMPHELSGGMAKRACLATALATGAGWLVADEPTTGLDPLTATRIMDVLQALADRGYGVIVISHDLPRLAAIATDITVLRDGRPVETAAAAAFRGPGETLGHPFTRALWQAQEVALAC